MYSQKVVLNLVSLIYDAAGDATRWPRFLEGLAQTLKASSATLFLQDLSNHKANTGATVGFDPAFNRSYEEYYGAKNIYLIRGRSQLWQGNVCLSGQLCPDQEVVRSEFYNEWIVPQGHGHGDHGILGVILKEKALTSMVGLIRERSTRRFSADDVSVLSVLVPHLQRSVQLHQRIITLESQKNAAIDALNQWSLGVILLDAQGTPLLLNHSADRILKEQDGLTLNRNCLDAATSADTSALRAAIHEAIQTTSSQASAAIPTKTIATNTDGHVPSGALLL